MAHIIFKTSKQKIAAPIPAAVLNDGTATIQPIVMDFTKNRSMLFSSKILLIAFATPASFFIASLFALFVLTEQLNGLWREVQTLRNTPAIIVAKKEETKIEPEAAFPATTLTPLPSKSLIIGTDFQATKSEKKVDLVPMLQRLPLYGKPAKTTTSHGNSQGSFIQVQTAPELSKSASLQQQADDALASGNTEKAIELYIKAVKISPRDLSLRSNCVALLLEQARFYDEHQERAQALTAYKKAQTLWQGDNETARGIKARIAYLEAKQ